MTKALLYCMSGLKTTTMRCSDSEGIPAYRIISVSHRVVPLFHAYCSVSAVYKEYCIHFVLAVVRQPTDPGCQVSRGVLDASKITAMTELNVAARDIGLAQFVTLP